MGSFKDRKLRQDKTRRNVEIVGISLAAFSAVLLLLLCLPLGKFCDFFFGVFGVAIFPLCVLLALFGVGVFFSQRYYLQKRYFVYLVLNFVFLLALLHVAIGSKVLGNAKISDYGKYLKDCYHLDPTLTVGGLLMGLFAYPLVCLLGVVGTCIVFAILLCIFVGLAVDFMFYRKKKLPRKDRIENRRILGEEGEHNISLSSLSHDYDTRATKLVPKKFEKEDNERYLGLQEKHQGAEYFSNRLQGIDVKSENEAFADVSSEELLQQESFDVPVNSVFEPQAQPEDDRSYAKNLLFGRKQPLQETATTEPSKVKSSVEEIYPSKYDPSIFASKREYITTPILPSFLNRKEIDRETVIRRNQQLMQEKQENNKISETREQVLFDTSRPAVRNTNFLTSVSNESEIEAFETKPEPVQPEISRRNSEPFAHAPSRQAPVEIEKEPVLAQEPIAKQDELEEFLPKQSFSPATFVDPLLKKHIDEVGASNDERATLRDNVQPQRIFEIPNIDSQPQADMPQRPVRGVRGPDLAPRKTPDRSGVRRVSDLVEEDKPSISEIEQKRFGTSASVVAPTPSFLERNQPRPVQQSMIADEKPVFHKEERPIDTRYVAPNPNLLTTKSDDPSKYGGDTVQKSRVLEETLESFRINAKVTNVVKGPSVTRYELAIPAGIPVRKIANYESNIAMTLMSKNGIRLELPIPGKNAVGVEIPNDAPCTVGLRDMVQSKEFQSASGALPVAIGKNISGEYVVRSMAKMVHLLVAGSTGSGKSVFLHNLILSLMFKSSPEQLRFIMIDPKRVEFIVYNGMPHMMLPNVVTECDKAINALSWATKEMDRRYRMFNQHLVNDIETYNKCPEVQSGQEKKIPYIVIVIDELADLMMVGQKEVERHIQRIAQLGRACGIHLVIATQRPTVQVVTGTIKANLPTRVAFSLTSVIDSKTILDEGGAEKLIGRGDMLFSPQGASQPFRLQAAFASLEEVKSIVKFLKQNNPSYFDEEAEKEIMASPEENREDVSAGGGGESVDEFFYPALRLFIETGTASTTMIQRRFGVGYARAARLVDQMEVKGYVSPQNGSKKRNVYITMDQYRELSGDED